MNDSFSDNATQDPAAIEQDIRRTQEDMSRTVDKIGNQLTMRNLFDALLDKADENDVDARYLVDGARRNPIALGLIAAGAIWLVSDKDSKFPTVKKGRSGSSDFEYDDSDIHHRDYVSHMSSVEWRDGEDEIAYQRRRDIARANFLMCEREPGEDEHGFRQRLNAMTDKFRDKRRAWSDSASQTASSAGRGVSSAGSAARDGANWVADRTEDAFYSNPLVGGILAAAVGAAFGSGLPISRQEQEKLGSLGEKARDAASQQTEQLTDTIRDKKDELVLKADERIAHSGSGQQPDQGKQGTPEFSGAAGSSGQSGSGFGSGPGSGQSSQPETPFIIKERNE